MRARALLALARPGRRGAAALGVVGGAGMSGLYLRGADSEFHSISDCEDLLPLTYEPERFEAVWREHPRVTAARLLEIGAGVTPLVARLAADATINALRNALGRAEAPQEAERRQKARASELRTLLTSLGPTFIKMGQMLSIRPDVLPPAAIELSPSPPSFVHLIHSSITTVEKKTRIPTKYSLAFCRQMFSRLRLKIHSVATDANDEITVPTRTNSKAITRCDDPMTLSSETVPAPMAVPLVPPFWMVVSL